jgi:hypothetical protein
MTDPRKRYIHPSGVFLDEVSCARCFYFRPKEQPIAEGRGDCWRYPSIVRRWADEWCGEFDPSRSPK